MSEQTKLRIIVECPDQGAGNDPEPFTKALHSFSGIYPRGQPDLNPNFNFCCIFFTLS